MRRASPRTLALVLGAVALWPRGAGAATAPGASRPPDFHALAYDVELDVDLGGRRMAGRERIDVRSDGEGLAVLTFPANGIRVLAVTSGTGGGLAHVETEAQIEIRLAAPLGRGERLSVAIDYEARNPDGVKLGADSAYTIFFTCHWMVCRERPDDKATLTLALTVPDELTVVASGVQIDRRRLGGGRAREVWSERLPSSPYLFGFAIGRLARTVRRHRGVTFEYYVPPDLDRDRLLRMFADDDRMLDFFVGKAGRPLPRPFYRQVVVDGGAAQEMSSFSVLGRQNLEPRLARAEEDWAVAHELAHQLWGNLVTCADWSHFWLNEGLTTFMVAAYKEQRWGRPAYERELQLARERYQAAIDAGLDVPLTFAGDYPSLRLKRAIVYSKAFLFLDRLRVTMGERAFWAALAKYTRSFAGRSVVSRDFQQVFAAETEKDLSKLFDDWVYVDQRPPPEPQPR
jgi:aminopeptidase N